MAVASQNAFVIRRLLQCFLKLNVRHLKSSGQRKRGRELHLMSQAIGLCFSQLLVLGQRFVKTLMPRKRRHVIGPRHMKLRCQFEATLKEQYRLANRTN